MNELKSLPKTYLHLIFLKLMLWVLVSLTVFAVLIGGIMYISYFNYNDLQAMLMQGSICWIVFILIFAVFVYYKKSKFENKIHYVTSFASTEIVAGAVIHQVNRWLHKILGKTKI